MKLKNDIFYSEKHGKFVTVYETVNGKVTKILNDGTIEDYVEKASKILTAVASIWTIVKQLITIFKK